MALNRRARVWLAAYVVVGVLLLVAEGLHARVPSFVFSFLAMPLLIGFFREAAQRGNRLHRFVTVALVFSWLGDTLGDLTLLLKLGLFFVGHVFYGMAFWPFHRRSVVHRPLALAAYVVVIGALIVWIAPHAEKLAVPVVIYGALLATMAVLSTGVNRTAGIGGAIFVSSDLSIAVTHFVLHGSFGQAELVIMSTYLVAQLLIVLGVAAIDPPGPSAGRRSADPDGANRTAPELTLP